MSRRGSSEEEGSFTLEASMLLPVVLHVMVVLVLLALYTYQASMLHQIAAVSAERTAFTWDNSAKEHNGAFAEGQYDSLYWRMTDDALLAALLGRDEPGGKSRITLPAVSVSGSLPEIKLFQAAEWIPEGYPGETGYAHSLTGRRTKTSLMKTLRLPVLNRLLPDGGSPQAGAFSMIAEPAEFIRTVELLRYYSVKFRHGAEESGTGNKLRKEDAARVLNSLPGR